MRGAKGAEKLTILIGKDAGTSSDFSDTNPYKTANGKLYTSLFQRAICLSREGNVISL